MSFVLTIWAQPAHRPLPTDVMQAQKQLEEVQATQAQRPDPRFTTLAHALFARYPGDDLGSGMYDGGLPPDQTVTGLDAYYNVGLWPRDEKLFEEGYLYLVEQANRLGLHVMDGQGGIAHLANGTMVSFDTPKPASNNLATAAALKQLGLNAALLPAAETGNARAQYELGQTLMLADRSQPVQTLAMAWMEKASAQGHTGASALLGDALVGGHRTGSVDVPRGMELLESSAAQGDAMGMTLLAQHLLKQSMRPGPDGFTPVLRTDAQGLQLQARIPGLLAGAAATGSGASLFDLAQRVGEGVGTPPDRVAASALMQLAVQRKARAAQRNPDIVTRYTASRSEAAEVDLLVREWGAKLAQLPELLQQRRAAQTRATTRSTTRTPARAPAQPRGRDAGPSDDEAHAPERKGLHLGHLALLIGALSFVVVMMPSLGKVGFRLMMLATGAISGYGVWRCTGDLGWGTAKRGFTTALALLPVAGFIACVAVLLQVVRQRTGGPESADE